MSAPTSTIFTVADKSAPPSVVSFDEVAWLRDNSPAWRLLRADHAPLVLSFLHQVFVTENVRSIPMAELAGRLDDVLYALNERGGETKKFPKTARAYLNDWAAPDAGWLRTYYPEGTDEPHVDATPAVEKALQWIGSLKEREFVGTESRLNTVIDLLRQIVFGTEPDPEQRIAELRRQREELDDQIARIEGGELDLLDASRRRLQPRPVHQARGTTDPAYRRPRVPRRVARLYRGRGICRSL